MLVPWSRARSTRTPVETLTAPAVVPAPGHRQTRRDVNCTRLPLLRQADRRVGSRPAARSSLVMCQIDHQPGRDIDRAELLRLCQIRAQTGADR